MTSNNLKNFNTISVQPTSRGLDSDQENFDPNEPLVGAQKNSYDMSFEWVRAPTNIYH